MNNFLLNSIYQRLALFLVCICGVIKCACYCTSFDLFSFSAVNCKRLTVDLCRYMGVATNFGVGVEEARPEGPRVGVGFLGRGQPAPPHQLGRLRERCKFPQRGSGAEPRPPKGFLVF